jgi:hypothetical protein
MKRSWLAIAALLLVVAALAAAVQFRPRDSTPDGYALSSLRAAEARQIRIERGSAPAIVLDRRGDRWMISAPIAAAAEEFHVQRLLAILDARASGRLPPDDLARFELAPPRARLTINDQVFGFGAINTVTREQYVLAAGAVYTVILNYGAALPAEVSQLIARRLFDAHEKASRFALRDVQLEMQDGAWRLTPPQGEASQDDFHRWVDAWQHASALRAEPYDQRKPLEEVRIDLAGGGSLLLGVLQHEPELVLARPERKLQYVFTAETGRRLLTPPGQKPERGEK